MKPKQVRKLETLQALIVEVYGADRHLVQWKDLEFNGYYATCDNAEFPDGYYLGETLDDALESTVKEATELMKQERIRRELHNVTATIKR